MFTPGKNAVKKLTTWAEKRAKDFELVGTPTICKDSLIFLVATTKEFENDEAWGCIGATMHLFKIALPTVDLTTLLDDSTKCNDECELCHNWFIDTSKTFPETIAYCDAGITLRWALAYRLVPKDMLTLFEL